MVKDKKRSSDIRALADLIPCQNPEEGEWLTPMEILSRLQTKTKDRLTINKVALFGRVLHKLNIENRRRNRSTEYRVIEID